MTGSRWKKSAIAAAISTVLVIGIAGCDGVGGKTDIEHVAAAKDFLDKNDTKSGAIELKSALQKNPENIEARRLLGELSLESGDGAAAEKEFRRAIELGLAQEAVILPLAKAMAMQGKFQEILDQIEAPNNLDASDQAEIISIRGNAWLSKRKAEKAKSEYGRALQVDPASGVAKLGLAKLAAAEKETAKADRLISEALEASPADSNIWLFQAELQRAKGEIDQAAASYTKAIELDSNSLAARHQRALIYIAQKNFESAQQDVNALKQLAPKSFQRHISEGLLAFNQKKFPEAQAAFDEALKLKGNFLQGVFFRGVSHLAQKHLAQAESDLRKAHLAQPKAVRPRQFLAEVKLRKREFKQAKALLVPVINSFPNDPVTLKMLGNIEFALGNTSEGLDYLQRLSGLQPDDTGTQAMLGLGFLEKGEYGKGIEKLEQVGQKSSNFRQGEAYIALAHLKAKQFDLAEEAIKKIGTKYPDSPISGNLYGLLFQARGESEARAEAFKSVLEKFPGNPFAALALADSAVEKKDFARAKELYESVLSKDPDNFKTQMRLAALFALEGDFKAMKSLLTDLIEMQPTILEPRLVLGRYYTQFGDASRAQTILEEARKSLGPTPELLLALFDAQLVDNKPSRALDTARELLRLEPGSARSKFIMARAEKAVGGFSAMKKSLKETLELQPDHVGARIALIQLLANDGEWRQSQQMLDSLINDSPENPDLIFLQGWMAEKKGDLSKAIKFYKKSLDKNPSSKRLITLAVASWNNNDKEGALGLLRNWINKRPNDLEAGLELSRLYSKHGDEEASIKILRKLKDNSPDNVVVLNDLAWKLRKSDYEEAMEFAEKAYRLAPKSTPVIDTFAMVLLERGDVNRAQSLLEKGVRIAPESAILQFHLAQVLSEKGEKESAINKLERLLLQRDQFPQRQEAVQLHKKWLKEKEL